MSMRNYPPKKRKYALLSAASFVWQLQPVWSSLEEPGLRRMIHHQYHTKFGQKTGPQKDTGVCCTAKDDVYIFLGRGLGGPKMTAKMVHKCTLPANYIGWGGAGTYGQSGPTKGQPGATWANHHFQDLRRWGFQPGADQGHQG